MMSDVGSIWSNRSGIFMVNLSVFCGGVGCVSCFFGDVVFM